MRTYMKYSKDSRNEKQDIQSLFPKSFGHVIVHDNRVTFQHKRHRRLPFAECWCHEIQVAFMLYPPPGDLIL